jgi:hypothetical protein
LQPVKTYYFGTQNTTTAKHPTRAPNTLKRAANGLNRRPTKGRCKYLQVGFTRSSVVLAGILAIFGVHRISLFHP